MLADKPSIHVTAPQISLHESKLGSNRLGDFVKLSGRVSHEHIPPTYLMVWDELRLQEGRECKKGRGQRFT
jgi:hypothetical protein